MKFNRSTSVALLAALLLVGCNVFEGAYEAGSSNDPKVLLIDAEQAMQAGEPEKAVVILEKAAAKTDPATFQGVQVNNLLGDAKLKVAGIGVLQLQQMVDDLNDRIENGTLGKVSIDPTAVCSFASPDEAVGVVTLDDIQGYTPIRNNPELITEVQIAHYAYDATDGVFASALREKPPAKRQRNAASRLHSLPR